MKFYVQVQRAGESGQWKQVNTWTNEQHAIQDAIHTYENHDNLASRDEMAVRVVKGKHAPVVIYERITS